MSQPNGYADLARFVEQVAAAQALTWRGMERVADLQLQAMEGHARAVQTATSMGAMVGTPARA